MNSQRSSPPTATAPWIGRGLSALVVLALSASAAAKLSHAPAVIDGLARSGFAEPLLDPLAALELACAALYAIPRTAALGAILVTGYLGGAVATHVRVDEAFAAPVLLGALAWVGLWLREPRLRALLLAGAPGPAAAPSAARRLRVTRIAQESPSTTSLHLESPGGRLEFRPGQFLQVRHGAHWRSYSLSLPPGDGVRLTIKRIAGGAVSGPLLDALREGDALEVRGPFGSFGDGLPATGAVLFAAAGSGVTPFASIVPHLRRVAPHVEVHMLFAVRAADDAPLLAELREQLGERLKLHVDARDGAFDPARARRLLDGLPALQGAWLCGPEAWMDRVAEAVHARWPAAPVTRELFSAATRARGPQRLTVMHDGRQVPVDVGAGESLLHAARRHGVDVPSGCEQGACGTCRIRVLQGTVATPDCPGLSPQDRAAGFALACVGAPEDGAVVEVA